MLSRARVRGRGGRLAIEQVGFVAQRLAVLLGAGISQPAAWRHLAAGWDDEHSAARLRRVAAIAAAGGDVAEALRQPVEEGRRPRAESDDAWAALAAVWAVAERAGAPLSSTLRTMAAAFREAGRLERSAAVALAGPQATTRLILALPPLTLAGGMLLGFDTLRVLGTPPGIALLCAGAVLLAGGWWWTSLLVRRASRRTGMPGLAYDLTAIAMSGGAPAARARDRAVAAFAEAGGVDPSAGPAIDRVFALAEATGAATAELLRGEAVQARLESESLTAERVARLGTLLMLPLGCCILPAFLAIGVAPLLLAVLSSTGLLP